MRKSRVKCGDDLQSLAKVQCVALVVPDNELTGSPRGFMHVARQRNAIALQRRGGCCRVVGLQIEMKVSAALNERDGGIALIHQLEVKYLVTGADAGIEVGVPEIESQTQPGRVEMDGCVQVGGAQLGDGAGYAHGVSSAESVGLI